MARFTYAPPEDELDGEAIHGEQIPLGFVTAEDLDAYESSSSDKVKRVLESLATIAVALVLMVIVRSFIVDSYVVPSGSMLQTIQLGDRLIGEKLSYRTRNPRAGEVVTFLDPDPTKMGTTLIKRVIAVEGQTVDFVDGALVVDGVEMVEPYAFGRSEALPGYASNLDGPITYPYTVPEGCIWVMGDNRENSLDSRYFGPVSIDNVSSHAVLIYWPPEDAGTLAG